MTFKKLMSDWYCKCHHGSQKVAYLHKSVSRVFKKAISISKRVTVILKGVTNLDLLKVRRDQNPLKPYFTHRAKVKFVVAFELKKISMNVIPQIAFERYSLHSLIMQHHWLSDSGHYTNLRTIDCAYGWSFWFCYFLKWHNRLLLQSWKVSAF